MVSLLFPPRTTEGVRFIIKWVEEHLAKIMNNTVLNKQFAFSCAILIW